MIRYFIWISILGSIAYSCTKPSSFGEELLAGETPDYDTLSLRVVCTVEREDSILTTDKTSSTAYFLCGSVSDPVFGASRSDIYSQLSLSFQTRLFKSTAICDSIALILPYAPNGFYGDTTIAQNLRVYMLTDTFRNRLADQYYSNQTVNAGDEIGSVLNFKPTPRTVAKLFDTTATATKSAYLKVPLSVSFGQQLLAVDSLSMTQNALFRKKIKGFKIESESAGDPGCMMAFNMNNNRCFVRMWYRVDTLRYTYDYGLAGDGQIKFTNFEHDYSGSTATAQLGQPDPDRLYLHGMGGLRIRAEVQGAAALDNILVNKAQLELVAEPEQTLNGIFDLPDQLIMTERNSSNAFVFIPDVNYAIDVGGTDLDFFGGKPEVINPGTTARRYYLTISKRLQDMVDDTSNNPANNVLYVNVQPQRLSARRAILYGPRNTTFPATIKVKYTRIQ
jgi:Domain of unknown function (DUF4270)